MSSLEDKVHEIKESVEILRHLINELEHAAYTQNPISVADDLNRRTLLSALDIILEILPKNKKKLKLKTLEKCEKRLNRIYSNIEKINAKTKIEQNSESNYIHSQLKGALTRRQDQSINKERAQICSQPIEIPQELSSTTIDKMFGEGNYGRHHYRHKQQQQQSHQNRRSGPPPPPPLSGPPSSITRYPYARNYNDEMYQRPPHGYRNQPYQPTPPPPPSIPRGGRGRGSYGREYRTCTSDQLLSLPNSDQSRIPLPSSNVYPSPRYSDDVSGPTTTQARRNDKGKEVVDKSIEKNLQQQQESRTNSDENISQVTKNISGNNHGEQVAANPDDSESIETGFMSKYTWMKRPPVFTRLGAKLPNKECDKLPSQDSEALEIPPPPPPPVVLPNECQHITDSSNGIEKDSSRNCRSLTLNKRIEDVRSSSNAKDSSTTVTGDLKRETNARSPTTFDLVRKKLAIVTKLNMQEEEIPTKPIISQQTSLRSNAEGDPKSPSPSSTSAAAVATSLSSTAAAPHTSSSSSTFAKFNGDPRFKDPAERRPPQNPANQTPPNPLTSATSSASSCSSSSSSSQSLKTMSMNVNVLPSINKNDPRLRILSRSSSYNTEDKKQPDLLPTTNPQSSSPPPPPPPITTDSKQKQLPPRTIHPALNIRSRTTLNLPELNDSKHKMPMKSRSKSCDRDLKVEKRPLLPQPQPQPSVPLSMPRQPLNVNPNVSLFPSCAGGLVALNNFEVPLHQLPNRFEDTFRNNLGCNTNNINLENHFSQSNPMQGSCGRMFPLFPHPNAVTMRFDGHQAAPWQQYPLPEITGPRTYKEFREAKERAAKAKAAAQVEASQQQAVSITSSSDTAATDTLTTSSSKTPTSSSDISSLSSTTTTTTTTTTASNDIGAIRTSKSTTTSTATTTSITSSATTSVSTSSKLVTTSTNESDTNRVAARSRIESDNQKSAKKPIIGKNNYSVRRSTSTGRRSDLPSNNKNNERSNDTLKNDLNVNKKTTLDKIYRTNIFPPSKLSMSSTSFKIPKKKTETVANTEKKSDSAVKKSQEKKRNEENKSTSTEVDKAAGSSDHNRNKIEKRIPDDKCDKRSTTTKDVQQQRKSTVKSNSSEKKESTSSVSSPSAVENHSEKPSSSNEKSLKTNKDNNDIDRRSSKGKLPKVTPLDRDLENSRKTVEDKNVKSASSKDPTKVGDSSKEIKNSEGKRDHKTNKLEPRKEKGSAKADKVPENNTTAISKKVDNEFDDDDENDDLTNFSSIIDKIILNTEDRESDLEALDKSESKTTESLLSTPSVQENPNNDGKGEERKEGTAKSKHGNSLGVHKASISAPLSVRNNRDDPNTDDEKTKKQNVVEEDTTYSLKANRISKRRCTMVVEGSKPVIDKMELLANDSFLFEDVQAEQRRKKISENVNTIESNVEKKRGIRSKEVVPEKNDDNCSVCIQNIITGKRRTRTTINFNETRHVQNIFNVRKQPPIESVGINESNSVKGDKEGALRPKNKSISTRNASSERSSGKTITTDTVMTTSTNDKTKKGCQNTREKKDINQGENVRKSNSKKLASGESTKDHQPAKEKTKQNKDISISDDSNINHQSLAENDEQESIEKKTNSGHAAKDESLVLNEFVKEILKPNADRKHILCLLGEILDKEKFELVKSIVKKTEVMEESTTDFKQFRDEMNSIESLSSTTIEAEKNRKDTKKIGQQNEDKNDNNKEDKDTENPTKRKDTNSNKDVSDEMHNSDICVKDNSNRQEKDGGAATGSECAPIKDSKKRRSELDRLNEDIRDMFISEGVLTATGKRMCTLTVHSDKEKTLSNTLALENENDNENLTSVGCALRKRFESRNCSVNSQKGNASPSRKSLRQILNNSRAISKVSNLRSSINSKDRQQQNNIGAPIVIKKNLNNKDKKQQNNIDIPGSNNNNTKAKQQQQQQPEKVEVRNSNKTCEGTEIENTTNEVALHSELSKAGRLQKKATSTIPEKTIVSRIRSAKVKLNKLNLTKKGQGDNQDKMDTHNSNLEIVEGSHYSSRSDDEFYPNQNNQLISRSEKEMDTLIKAQDPFSSRSDNEMDSSNNEQSLHDTCLLSNHDNSFTDSDTETDETDESFLAVRTSCVLPACVENVNINWHSQSKYVNWCVICKAKLSGRHGTHYKLLHSENYVSRLAPCILNQFKCENVSNMDPSSEQCSDPVTGLHPVTNEHMEMKMCGKVKPYKAFYGVKTFKREDNVEVKQELKWYTRCPFCMLSTARTFRDWFEHFHTHTSECRYECSNCFCGSKRKLLMRRHINGNDNCRKAKINENMYVLNEDDTNIVAHVCHLCNYIQLERKNLLRHYIRQHNIDEDNAKGFGYLIVLLDIKDVMIFDCNDTEGISSIMGSRINPFENQIINVDDVSDKEEDNEQAVKARKRKQGKDNALSDDLNTPKDSPEREFKRKRDDENVDQRTPECSNSSVQLEDEQTSSMVPEDENGQWEDIEDMENSDSGGGGGSVDESRSAASITHGQIAGHAFRRRKSMHQKFLSAKQNNRNIMKMIFDDNKPSTSKTTSSRVNNKDGNRKNDNSGNRLDGKRKSPPPSKSPCGDTVRDFAPVMPLSEDNVISSQPNAHLIANEENRSIEGTSHFVMDEQKKNKVVLPLFDSNLMMNEQAAKLREAFANTFRNINIPTTMQSKAININRIENIGYTSTIKRNEENGELEHIISFYCMLKQCSFLYSSDPFGLEAHFDSEHKCVKWSSYCHICYKHQSVHRFYTIKEEIEHMENVHVHIQSCIFNQIIQQQQRQRKQQEAARPRITLRRLSGDCLSSSSSAVAHNGEKGSVNPQTARELNQNDQDESVITDFVHPNEEPTPSSVPLNDEQQPQIPEMKLNEPMALLEPYPLQITNVVSLHGDSITMGTNECLNGESGALNQTSPIELDELQKLKELLRRGSMEEEEEQPYLTPTINTANITIDNNPSSLEGTLQVASEDRVPMATARSGNYLITQYEAAMNNNNQLTVTQQQRDPHVNIEISMINTAKEQNNAKRNPIVNPLYTCKARRCRYSTRMREAMIDHLKFHQIHCLNGRRDYLTCGICKHVSKTIGGYMKHVDICSRKREQQSDKKDCLEMDEAEYNSKLQDVTSMLVKPCTTFDPNTRLAIKKFRCVNNECALQLTESDFCEHIQLHYGNIMNGNYIEDQYYYNCPYCTQLYQKPQQLTDHVLDHARGRFFCYLCKQISSTFKQMVDHITVVHKTTRKPCLSLLLQQNSSLCDNINNGQNNNNDSNKESNPTIIAGTTEQSLNDDPVPTESMKPSSLTIDDGRSLYIVSIRPLTSKNVDEFGRELIWTWCNRKTSAVKSFSPSEIDKIPLKPIFPHLISCDVCNYSTKVRTNLHRHLMLHLNTEESSRTPTAKVDPVNPVPCLNSNEKFFDKMTNLASGSVATPTNSKNTGAIPALITRVISKDGFVIKPKQISLYEMENHNNEDLQGSVIVPNENNAVSPSTSSEVNVQSTFIKYAYVSENSRYRCGIKDCNYLTISESLFRSHLIALHNSNVNYTCPFCDEEICKRGLSIAKICMHLRYHGPVLYRCDLCNYQHPLKFLVDRHINDRHTVSQAVITKHERNADGEKEGIYESISFCGKRSTNNGAENQPSCSTTFHGEEEAASTSNAVAGNSTAMAGSGTSASIVNSSSYNGSKNGGVKYKWICSLCRHLAVTLTQIQNHCQREHGKKLQYQCIYCSYEAGHLAHVLQHVDKEHPNMSREARSVYYRLIGNEEDELQAMNTRPLWLRDDPNRIRHIRGILVEDERETDERLRQLASFNENEGREEDDVRANRNQNRSKRRKKSLTTDCQETIESILKLTEGRNYQDESNSENETVADEENWEEDEENLLVINFNEERNFLRFDISYDYEYGCYHCDYVTRNLVDLKRVHFPKQHNTSPETAEIFLYVLLKRYCCPRCRKFVGNYRELTQHLQVKHHSTNYCALPIHFYGRPQPPRRRGNEQLTYEDRQKAKRSIECGYCSFKTNMVRHLMKHHRTNHKVSDIYFNDEKRMKELLQENGLQDGENGCGGGGGNAANYNLSYAQCKTCYGLFSNRKTVISHACEMHPGAESFSYNIIKENPMPVLYKCPECPFVDRDVKATYRHVIEHYPAFSKCHYCEQEQTNFNEYMEHCYSEHRGSIRLFKSIYPFVGIRKFLQQTQIVCPNGLVLKKVDLMNGQLGTLTDMYELYEELSKTSQQPPIPRLSLGRLVARRDREQESQRNRSTSSTSSKVSKRRTESPRPSGAMEIDADQRMEEEPPLPENSAQGTRPSSLSYASLTGLFRTEEQGSTIDAASSSSPQNTNTNLNVADGVKLKKRRCTISFSNECDYLLNSLKITNSVPRMSIAATTERSSSSAIQNQSPPETVELPQVSRSTNEGESNNDPVYDECTPPST